jgi:SAM-dependent methyltransferase
MGPWFDDESFWAEFHDVLFSRERWESTVESADQILSRTAPAEGGSVLDLCCGPGRFSLEFARRGFRVTGVDRTAAYIEEARAHAAAERLEIEFVTEDMRRFRRAGAFDLAISVFTSFGYFDDPVDDLRVAENLFASLRPGGRLALDVVGKEVIARGFRPMDASWVDEDRKVLLLEERKLRCDWGWIDTTWTLIRDTERTSRCFGLRLYSGVELIDLLRRAGFSAVTLHGGIDGSPYDHKARRLVAIAVKGEGKA